MSEAASQDGHLLLAAHVGREAEDAVGPAPFDAAVFLQRIQGMGVVEHRIRIRIGMLFLLLVRGATPHGALFSSIRWNALGSLRRGTDWWFLMAIYSDEGPSQTDRSALVARVFIIASLYQIYRWLDVLVCEFTAEIILWIVLSTLGNCISLCLPLCLCVC